MTVLATSFSRPWSWRDVAAGMGTALNLAGSLFVAASPEHTPAALLCWQLAIVFILPAAVASGSVLLLAQQVLFSTLNLYLGLHYLAPLDFLLYAFGFVTLQVVAGALAPATGPWRPLRRDWQTAAELTSLGCAATASVLLGLGADWAPWFYSLWAISSQLMLLVSLSRRWGDIALVSLGFLATNAWALARLVVGG